jgi:two-component system response regulator MprA
MLILVVEDDRAVRDSLRRALQLEGYEVEVACDGHQALAWLNRAPAPDLVILDLRLPRVGGLEVCEFMQRTGRTIPVVVLTADHERTTREAATAVGARAYITKPFALADLLQHVRRLLPP